jgi:pimeloyl-ACP methyl ester carboxylesterase
VRCSNRIRAGNIEQYWLRFMSPVAKAGESWARVYEPRTAEPVPTLIFLHGIGMEWEFWPNSADPMPAIAARGIRVIRTEGPWHGRRQARGWFSGEPTIANGPVGFIDLFAAWVAESAALIEWTRKNFPGKVALGGVSLGALSAQLVATAAANWRPSQIPDGLLLITTTRDFEAICLDSGFAHALDAPDRLAANGWRREDLQACLPILAPQGELAIPPERIVMLLGDADNVTPIAGGRDLIRDWNLPPANVFLRHRGHFSAGLGALAETAALDRLWEVLRAAA